MEFIFDNYTLVELIIKVISFQVVLFENFTVRT